jgi:hypothetical protein
MRDVFPILEYDYYDTALQSLLGPALYKAPFRVRPPPPPQRPTTNDVLFPSSPQQGHQSIRILIFSEDAPYARALAGTWRIKYPGVFVAHVDASHETVSPLLESFDGDAPPREVAELLMMSACDDLVIANSSFSWWGAYWNRNPGRRVVAPTQWFVAEPYPSASHLYPAGWILL